MLDLTAREIPPEPWSEGDNIPWDEPGFSRRMLAEHLSQTHDAASRRAETIERQVAWIHQTVLHGRPSRILDLGCGPGLYTQQLARLGHTCVGIDYSPAAIDYARQQAAAEGLDCRYELADLRRAAFGHGFGLVMLIYGELNVFPRAVATDILAKAARALDAGGVLLIEPHTLDAIRAMGERPAFWYTAERGVFGDSPYLCLQEHFWDDSLAAATTRSFVVDLSTGDIARYAQSFQSYTDAGYRGLVEESGFTGAQFYPSLTGALEADQRDFQVIVARKPAHDARRG